MPALYRHYRIPCKWNPILSWRVFKVKTPDKPRANARFNLFYSCHVNISLSFMRPSLKLIPFLGLYLAHGLFKLQTLPAKYWNTPLLCAKPTINVYYGLKVTSDSDTNDRLKYSHCTLNHENNHLYLKFTDVHN